MTQPMPVKEYLALPTKVKQPRRKPVQRESQLQQACVKWFKIQYPVFRFCLFAIPNAGQRDVINASRMKAEGMLSGVPDLFLAVPTDDNGGLFIELKAGKGKPSVFQRIIMEQLRMHLYEVKVCRSLDEFMKAVNNYLDLS